MQTQLAEDVGRVSLPRLRRQVQASRGSIPAGAGAAAAAPARCGLGGLGGRARRRGEREPPAHSLAPAVRAREIGLDRRAHWAALLERALAAQADVLVGRHRPKDSSCRGRGKSAIGHRLTRKIPVPPAPTGLPEAPFVEVTVDARFEGSPPLLPVGREVLVVLDAPPSPAPIPTDPAEGAPDDFALEDHAPALPRAVGVRLAILR
jgi:hypothetical protein